MSARLSAVVMIRCQGIGCGETLGVALTGPSGINGEKPWPYATEAEAIAAARAHLAKPVDVPPALRLAGFEARFARGWTSETSPAAIGVGPEAGDDAVARLALDFCPRCAERRASRSRLRLMRHGGPCEECEGLVCVCP